MEKNIKLCIVGSQSGGDLPEPQRVELKTEGFLKERDGMNSIYYEEIGEETGRNYSFFKYNRREAEHTKKGDIATTLRFCPGEQTNAYYDTPYGRFLLEIATTHFFVEESNKGGTVEIKYTMKINEGGVMDCLTKVTWERI